MDSVIGLEERRVGRRCGGSGAVPGLREQGRGRAGGCSHGCCSKAFALQQLDGEQEDDALCVGFETLEDKRALPPCRPGARPWPLLRD